MEAITKKIRLETKFVSLLMLLLFILTANLPIKANVWHSVGNSREINISGMALVEDQARQTVFVVVHDNKKKNQKRAGIIRINDGQAPIYTPLAWLGEELPVDLEAITAIFEKPNNFMALTSAGKIYHIELDQNNNSVQVIKSFNIPSAPIGGDFEGVAFQKIGETQLIVWAERGEDAKPGTLFWSKFDLGTYTFTQTESASIKVPFPNNNVRHISDLKLDRQGKIFISSAADPGNDGPFASAVYLAGNFNIENPSRIVWNQSTEMPQVYSIQSRKIEAFEIMPGERERMAFGTDDENLGSAIYLDWQKSNVTSEIGSIDQD